MSETDTGSRATGTQATGTQATGSQAPGSVPAPRRVEDKLLLGPLVTDRLVVSEAGESDLPEMIAVARSNPWFLYAHNAQPGEPESLTPIMAARDVVAARMDPFRHPLVIRKRGSDASGPAPVLQDGDIVGWAEALDLHPSDRCPWIGLLELHAAVQRRGLGREAAVALIGWYRDLGAERLRVAVDDESATRFWAGLGFRFAERRPRADGTSGPAPDVTVMELALDQNKPEAGPPPNQD